MHSMWVHILRVLEMNTNHCVDVNTPLGLYGEDSPFRLMSQETAPDTTTTARFVVTRQQEGDAPNVTSTDMIAGINYTFDGDTVISIVKEVTTVTRTVVYSKPTETDYQEMSEHYLQHGLHETGIEFHPANHPDHRPARKVRAIETAPREPCFSSCCNTEGRRTRNGTCAGCRKTANRTQLPRYFNTPNKRMWWVE